MRASLYETAGGADALLRLAHAHHARCLADPELNHPFSHPDGHPQHLERLAAYWGEVLGGPRVYSTAMSSQFGLLELHAGNGDMSDLARRFVVCFDQAIEDAGLPDDPEFRRVLHDYMVWAVGDVLAWDHVRDTHPPRPAVPLWTWDGLADRALTDPA